MPWSARHRADALGCALATGFPASPAQHPWREDHRAALVNDLQRL